MVIDKRDRTALKSYFKKNAIPTESNFKDLIDGMINQQEDGIVKLADEPLSLQADNTSQKKAINFYKNFAADPGPAWTLSLNPRGNPNDPKTAKPGWSIGDAGGNSKLFIDETTGNIGVGTVEPGGYKLNVNGPALFTGSYLFVNSENAGRLRVGAAWGMPGLYSSDDGAKPLVVGVPALQKVYLGFGTTDAFVEGGTGNSYFKGNVGIGTPPTPGAKLQLVHQNQDANGGILVLGPMNQPHLRLGYHADYSWIQSHGSKPLAINPLGNNVGIGTAAPTHRFHVVANDAVGLFESNGTQAYLRLSTREGLDNRVEIANRPGGRLSLWTAGASEAFNILRGGNVGIGTAAPTHRFHVVANDAVGLLESSGTHAYLRLSTREGLDNRVEIANRPGGRLGLWTVGGGDVLSITKDGNVGIGTINPANKLDVAGNVSVSGSIGCGGRIWIRTSHDNGKDYIGANPDTGNVFAGPNKLEWESFTLEMSSSRDLKENVSALSGEEAMATLERLSPVKYDYKGEQLFRQNLGFIAEDMPDNLASESRKTLSPFEITPVLTKVVQEQQKVLFALQEKIHLLEEEVKQYAKVGVEHREALAGHEKP